MCCLSCFLHVLFLALDYCSIMVVWVSRKCWVQIGPSSRFVSNKMKTESGARPKQHFTEVEEKLHLRYLIVITTIMEWYTNNRCDIVHTKKTYKKKAYHNILCVVLTSTSFVISTLPSIWCFVSCRNKMLCAQRGLPLAELEKKLWQNSFGLGMAWP